MFVDNSRNGEYDTATEEKYASIQEMFVEITLQCNKLNERLWIYKMVDFLKIPILRYPNAIHTKFRFGGQDTKLYPLAT